ncbi:MAG: hypothetical protein WA783_22175, partial [Phormidesmis sp.]
LHCGRKDKQLFEQALTCLAEVIKQTGSISLLTDGERRYGNLFLKFVMTCSVLADRADWPSACPKVSA